MRLGLRLRFQVRTFARMVKNCRSDKGGPDRDRSGGSSGTARLKEHPIISKPMSERPILFSSQMVRAILEGGKTQTRRLIKMPIASRPVRHLEGGTFVKCANGEDWWVPCPYGTPSDHLWVRETHYRFGNWHKDGKTKSGRVRWRFVPKGKQVAYLDAAPDAIRTKRSRMVGWYKRPAIFMPRWASRITLELTGVRVERLRQITPSDCAAEGIEITATDSHFPTVNTGTKLRAKFERLWNSINAKRAPWASNPWVWVIEFKRIG